LERLSHGEAGGGLRSEVSETVEIPLVESISANDDDCYADVTEERGGGHHRFRPCSSDPCDEALCEIDRLDQDAFACREHVAEQRLGIGHDHPGFDPRQPPVGHGPVSILAANEHRRDWSTELSLHFTGKCVGHSPQIM